MTRLKCSEVWGGVHDQDVDVCSAGINASLVSLACDGGKGGDIYYLSVCDVDMLTRVVVADVVGHGPQVSQVSQWLFDSMKMELNNVQGNAILERLNELAMGRGLNAMTTAGVAAFYRADSRFYFAYAGHHEMLVLRQGSARWERATLQPPPGPTGALPLGVLDEADFPQSVLPLGPRDRFVLYTDGVIEAPSPTGDLFGLDRLLAVLNANRDRPLPHIKREVMSALRHHTGGSLSHDDVTLLIFEIRPPTEPCVEEDAATSDTNSTALVG